MPISRRERWIQIATLDSQDRIIFTDDFRELAAGHEWDARKLAAHLLASWSDPYEGLLDFTSGDAEVTEDQPGRFNVNGLDEPQDVVEHWARSFADGKREGKLTDGLALPQLDASWYRDVLRAKLVSIRLPKRLLDAWLEGISRD